MHSGRVASRSPFAHNATYYFFSSRLALLALLPCDALPCDALPCDALPPAPLNPHEFAGPSIIPWIWMAMAGVYTENLRLYNARTHAYKSGILEAKDMTDDQARAYADTHNISTAPAEISANDQLNAESLLDLPAADAASLPSSPEAAAARATPKGKVRGKKVGGKVLTPAPEPAAIVPSSTAKAGSPDKKRKRLSKRGEETAVAGVEEDKGGKGRKKKARGE